MTRIALTLLFFFLLSACVAPPVTDPLAALRQDDGTVVWEQDYTFMPPGDGWQLFAYDEDDYNLAFALECVEVFPCLSAMAYAEEPFGYSRNLEQRQEEFFKRYLWASRVVFNTPMLEKKILNGKEVLIATVEGIEPVRKQKVWSKVVFMHRGERVVAFYLNQWRPGGASYDKSIEIDFDRFVESFRYLKPSFFETL